MQTHGTVIGKLWKRPCMKMTSITFLVRAEKKETGGLKREPVSVRSGRLCGVIVIVIVILCLQRWKY